MSDVKLNDKIAENVIDALREMKSTAVHDRDFIVTTSNDTRIRFHCLNEGQAWELSRNFNSLRSVLLAVVGSETERI